MAPFLSLKTIVPEEVIQSFEIVWQNLGKPGAWWTGYQRIEIAKEVRNSNQPALGERINDLSQYSHQETESLSPYVRAVIRKIAYESSTIDRNVYQSIEEVLGQDRYAELAAIVTQVVPIFTLADILGYTREKLPTAHGGSPTKERPEDLVNDVAFLPTFSPKGLPHVAVSLSLAQADNARRMLLVRSMYSGTNFGEMVWDHRSLSRQQIELVAARTSSINECFY
tara:strand:+ start:1867 stop:2541 length:675 start_codon:yes stop_codon:yes gene_type:complete